MIHETEGGREEGDGGEEASDPASSNGPYEMWSHKDSGEEAELVMYTQLSN